VAFTPIRAALEISERIWLAHREVAQLPYSVVGAEIEQRFGKLPTFPAAKAL